MTEPRIYRASSLGYSLEQLVCPHLGYDAIPPPEWLQKKFNEGTEIEPKCVEKLRDKGWKITTEQVAVNNIGDFQIEVELEVIPGVAKVVGHLDGILHHDAGDSMVLEIKSMAAKSWEEWQKKGWDTPGLIQKYKWQASIYMLATGLPHMMVAWNKDTEELHEVDCYEPFYGVSDIANKLQAAEDHINRGTIPEGCTDYPCAYFYLHAPVEAPEPAPKDLDSLLDAWKLANQRKKAFEKDEAELRDMIKEYVGEIASKVKGSQGITVSTNWIEGKDVSYFKPGHWETRITTPREKKDG